MIQSKKRIQIDPFQAAILLFILSFVIVAFGQPGWHEPLSWCSPLAAVCGYALCWRALLFFKALKHRFLLAMSWYGCVQAVQLSWMTSIEFHGVYILFIYAGLVLLLGAQCGLIVLTFRKTTWQAALAFAALWTIAEWSRLHILCGFSFNPAGLALTKNPVSMQLAAVGGVFFLSFWVIFVNFLALRVLLKRNVRRIIFFGISAVFPYFFGYLNLIYQEGREDEKLSVALVQTDLLPSQKNLLPGRKEEFISPLKQWTRMIKLLSLAGKHTFDLIVLPETAVPFGYDLPIYPLESVVSAFEKGTPLPPFQYPFAGKNQAGYWSVSNAFWAQMLANAFRAEVIVGLDHWDKKENHIYNAAFHFIPDGNQSTRYEKRVLLPLAEYLPFEWLRSFVGAYGITEFFTKGHESTLFLGKVPMAASICYEETFSEFMRESRRLGARLFVNLTNDNWYPFSRLAEQHFDLAKLRAVENGVALVRSSNNGQTAVVDHLGRTLAKMNSSTNKQISEAGVLAMDVPIYSYQTFYTLWGDKGILCICLLCLIPFYLLKMEGSANFFRK